MKFNKQLLKSPSGFPEMTPGESVALQNMQRIIAEEFEHAGFSPLETPLVERPEVLAAKSEGEITKQIYGLRLLNPDKNRADDSKDLALRFDHTVPLARYVAANQSVIIFPFRRSVIGPVFRGERAKAGRYRQFTQADIDVIGKDSLDLLHDAEIVSIIARVFRRLDIGNFTIRIGHRKILQGLLELAGLSNEQTQKAALDKIDQLEKAGTEEVVRGISELGIGSNEAAQFIDKLAKTQTIKELKEGLGRVPSVLSEGIDELETVMSGVVSLGVSSEDYVLDLTIARGLDYYTGTVYETRFDAYPNLGSIASGGRYDDLAGSYINENLPGVGISIGVTRLLKRLVEANLYPAQASTMAPVLVTGAEESDDARRYYLQIAARIREAGIGVESFLEKRSLGKQMKFADKRGFKIVIIARQENVNAGTAIVRNMETGDEQVVSLEGKVDNLVNTVKKLIY